MVNTTFIYTKYEYVSWNKYPKLKEISINIRWKYLLIFRLTCLFSVFPIASVVSIAGNRVWHRDRYQNTVHKDQSSNLYRENVDAHKKLRVNELNHTTWLHVPSETSSNTYQVLSWNTRRDICYFGYKISKSNVVSNVDNVDNPWVSGIWTLIIQMEYSCTKKKTSTKMDKTV